ncbi:MAG: hypothetical protein A3K19_20840 [Lentisphaerae bacterium RIFOXYB12_FULL_65_16]|nr:MAG: hypothetical protein A3K18_19265 [Lentisphaerae bacterium RIFOXYA12_64_32]OGV85182.1 MAG: hypothetical protein A3K19_20840 [Lentisphaerae bacterium RIFOXYB12_FULL_65_16]
MKTQENYTLHAGVGLVLVLLTIVGLSFYWIGEQARMQTSAQHLLSERIARAQKLYANQCADCHGTDGEGGAGPALNDRKILKDNPDEVFYSVIRSGVPSTEMTAWSISYGGPLTDEDVRDLVAMLRSWEVTGNRLPASPGRR